MGCTAEVSEDSFLHAEEIWLCSQGADFFFLICGVLPLFQLQENCILINSVVRA